MDLFPTLIGRGIEITRSPQFSTERQRSVSLRELRIRDALYPLYNFRVPFELLRDDPAVISPAAPNDEHKKLFAFFLAQGGSWKSWLYPDPTDGVAIDTQFGIGNGSTLAFQLTRTYGITGGVVFTEPVMNPVLPVTNVKDNGVVVNPANYTVSAEGLVTFTVAPLNGRLLTWNGTYRYRCRFVDDMTDFKQFLTNWWENKALSFVGSPGDKI